MAKTVERRNRRRRRWRRRLLRVAPPVASVVAALFLGVVQYLPEYRRPCHPSLLLLLPAAARHPQGPRRQQEGVMMPKTRRRRRRQGGKMGRMRRPATFPRNHCRVDADDPHEQGGLQGRSHHFSLQNHLGDVVEEAGGRAQTHFCFAFMYNCSEFRF
jgi:hypothetical protein